jgi:hypothetical protein
VTTKISIGYNSILSKDDNYKNINIFIGVLLIAVLGLVPAYIWPSGGFQIIDIPLATIIAVTLLDGNKYKINMNQVYYLIPLVAWIIVVDLSYAIFHSDISYLYGLAPYLYAPFIIYTFTIIYSRALGKNQIYYIYLGLIFSIIVTFTVKGVSEEGRAILSFNDPNQLGYFSVILLSYVILLIRFKEIRHIGNVVFYCLDGLLILFAHYFLALSVSRSAMGGILILDICFLKNIRKLKIFFPVMLFVIISSLAINSFSPEFIQERLATRPGAFAEQGMDQQFKQRALSPLNYLKGIEILVGRGQGGWRSRKKGLLTFGKVKGYGGESHNAFGEMVRGEGLIGLTLLLLWLGRAIWGTRILTDAFWIWGGLLMFNMGNFGLRWRGLWILLSLLFAMVNLVDLEKSREAGRERLSASVKATTPGGQSRLRIKGLENRRKNGNPKAGLT